MRLQLWVSSFWLVALVTSGCKKADPPSGFGVNVVVRPGTADLSAATTVSMTVNGDDPDPYAKTVDVVAQVKAGEARFRYIPKKTDGSLSIHIDALDGTSAVLASGDSGPVAIRPGQAAQAVIVLGAAQTVADMAVTTNADMATKVQGAACSASSECGTAGGCVDGRCCNSPCADACNACNVVGKEGICSPLAGGATPGAGHPTCGPDAASSCQRDGKCDGAGACRLYAFGTECKAPTCDSGTNQTTAASTCDGKGSCVAATARTCAPYICNGNTCFDTCTGTATGCSGTNTCNAGSCGPKTLGATCTAGAQCASNKCVDSVCCENDCTGPCNVCNSLGKCVQVPQGQDPRSQCPKGTGNDANCTLGGCSGTVNACQLATPGSACGGSCNTNTPTLLKCDGTGSCSQSSLGASCSSCQQCSVSSTNAACVALPDTTVCGTAHCVDNLGYPEVKCSSGFCPAQTPSSCGAYKCRQNGPSATTCFTDCGSCCCQGTCGDPTVLYCASGHTCNSSGCASCSAPHPTCQ